MASPAPIFNQERETNATSGPNRNLQSLFTGRNRRKRRGRKGAGSRQRRLLEFRERIRTGRRNNRIFGIKSPKYLKKLEEKTCLNPEPPPESQAGFLGVMGKNGRKLLLVQLGVGNGKQSKVEIALELAKSTNMELNS